MSDSSEAIPQDPEPGTPTKSGKQASGAMEEYYTRIRNIDGQYMQTLVNHSHDETFNVDMDGKTKVFKRKKISTKKWNELENIRAELNAIPETDQDARNKKIQQLYRSCAYSYLIDPDTGQPMTDAQYDDGAFEDVRFAVDTSNLRTLRGLGFFPIDSGTSSTSGGVG